MPKKNRGEALEWRPERNIWEIVWFHKGKRKRRSTGTDDREKADKALTEHKERARRRQTSRLVDDALNDYQLEHAPHTERPEDIAHCVINLTPFFGDLSVPEVTKAKCQEYAVKRKTKTDAKGNVKTISDASIRKDLEILRAALNHDHAEGRCQKDFYVWMPEKPEPRAVWLTRKQAAALLRAARNDGPWHLAWFIILSLYSGQRKSAVLNLTWDRVDLDNGKINWQYGKKTNKRRPNQPMPDALRMFMRYLSRYSTAQGYVLHRDGHRIGRVTKSLATALKTAKIEKASTHTLKHTALTWMMQSGTDIWSVAGFTGTSLKTIENTYAHHAPDYLEDARNSSKRGRERRRLPQRLPQEKDNNIVEDKKPNESKE